jgi:hypothetical protein
MSEITARHRHRGGRVHTIVHAGGRLFELLIGGARDLNGQPAGYTLWFREHNQLYPDEAAAERAGLRAIERLVGRLPEPAYQQLMLPLEWERLWPQAA